MHVMFTEEELQWINKKRFSWTVMSGCPQKLRTSIDRKLRSFTIPQVPHEVQEKEESEQ